MILSISEAAKKFKISRSKIYRMRDSGQLSLTTKSDKTTGIDLSEMLRVFGGHVTEQQSETKSNSQGHDPVTENFYLKKEIETLIQNLQRSEARVDQLMVSTQEQTKQLLLTHSKSDRSFWQRLWKK